MFLENAAHNSVSFGWIEVICGSMFSGKTEESIRRIKRAQIAHLNVAIFKPVMDDRYDQNKVVSHDSNQLAAMPVAHSAQLFDLAQGFDVVGVDEAQFFDPAIVKVCNDLANQGIRVIVAGLDMDYTGKPFGPMPALMATAEYVTKVHAICTRTGRLAHFSFRTNQNDDLVLLGETDNYEALSRSAFYSAMRDERSKQSNETRTGNDPIPLS